MTEKVEKQRLSEAVVDRIKRLIVEDRLRPGDRLPTEISLAERFGVSRVSVREATRALGFFGILNAKPGRGLTVGRINMARVSKCLSFQLAPHDYPQVELIESRIVVETGILPYVMQQMEKDPRVYQDLNRINEKLRKTRLIDERIALDAQFHRQLYNASGLGPLIAFNDLIQIFFDSFRKSFRKGLWESGIVSHQKIIDSLRDSKLEAACNEMRRHIDTHRNNS